VKYIRITVKKSCTIRDEQKQPNRCSKKVTCFIDRPSSRYQHGSDPLRAAAGGRPGHRGQLQVPGERQQTQRGQRQRLPHPVVAHQLRAQKVRKKSQ